MFIPTDGTVKPIGRVVPLIIPGAELAVARHHGSPSDIDVTYGELGAYVMKHEISVDGPLRENYLRGIAETAEHRRVGHRDRLADLPHTRLTVPGDGPVCNAAVRCRDRCVSPT